MGQWLGSRRRRILTASAIALVAGGAFGGGTLAASGASTAQATTAASTTRTVTVSATGQVNGTPDTLTLTMDVSTTAASASAALERNNADMTSVQSTLTAAGVPTSDLQTSNLTLNANTNAKGKVVNYEADDTLVVTLSDLAKAGAVIDAAAHAAGNAARLEGISFSISDTSGLLDQARRQAMANATKAATTLAQAAGATLGPVLKITDENETLPSPPTPFAAAGTARSVPVQPGTQPVSVQLEVVFSLVS